MKTLVGLTVREAIERATHWSAEMEVDSYNEPHLDSTVKRVLVSPHGFDRALITDDLAWVIRSRICAAVVQPLNRLVCDVRPSALCVYRLRLWLESEGQTWSEPIGASCNVYDLTEERMKRRRA